MTHLHSKEKQAMLTLEEAQRRFSYDPTTGDLRRTSGPFSGISAGSTTTNGYLHAYVKGKHFAVHRLCWLLHFGKWPDGDIDHINGNKRDNRIVNLRSVSVAENNATRPGLPPPKNYGFDRSKGLWRAYTGRGGTYRHLGYFATEFEAAAAAASL